MVRRLNEQDVFHHGKLSPGIPRYAGLQPLLEGGRNPTLLLVGEELPTSTSEQQRLMAEQLPDCRLMVYPGLGHGINAIHPEWCTQQVRKLLASLTV